MEAGRDQDSESLEDLQRRGSDELAHEEQGDAAIDRLIANIADRQRPERSPEPHGPTEDEFACRACHLIFSRSYLADRTRVFCGDCAALAAEGGVLLHEVPPVHRGHHPCPACGALLMVPEREEITCGFICPSCRVHLMKRDDRLHLVWNHRDALIERVEEP